MRLSILPVLVLVACGGGDFGFGSNTGGDDVPVGTARMTLSAEELVFEDLEVDAAQTQFLVVANSGDTLLEYRGGEILGSDPEVFFIPEDPDLEDANLSPDSTKEIRVTARIEEIEPASAYFRLHTNDVDRPVLDIPLTGWPLGWTGDTDGGDTDTDAGQ
jgi:hypothetical protein